jgi:hypothetical protein
MNGLILNTVAQATDDKVRKVESSNLLDRTKAGIPVLRQTLPTKINQATGEEIKGEGFWTNLLFGSRVKTANESALIDEITRLDAVGYAPTVADIERNSEKVKGLKSQRSEEGFQNALQFYGRAFGKQATKQIKTNEYRKASDEKKQAMLNSLRDKVRTDMLKKFGYKAPKKKGKKS